MKSKLIFCLAALPLMMFTAGNLWAQGLPSDVYASPQSDATQGRYRSDSDNFMRVDSWKSVRFDKWFGFTSFAASNTASSANRMAMGFAAKAGDIFLSGIYTGNFWAGKPANNYNEATVDFFGTNKNDYPVYTGTPNVATGSTITPHNNFGVMIGVADMGIRLLYRTTHQSFKDSEIRAGGIPTWIPDPDDPDPDNPTLPFVPGPTTNGFYKNYETAHGLMAPQIAWAMAKDLTKVGIRPYVIADLNFHRNYLKTEYYTSATVTTGQIINNSQNYFEPVFTVGLGGVTFVNKNGFRASVDIDYDLTLRFYNNEYNFVTGTDLKVGTLSGFNANGTFTEKNYINNQIIPSLSGQWGKDKVALRFKLNLPVNITSEEDTRMRHNNNGALEKHGESTDTTTFGFRPDFRLAFQWRAIPNRLTINTSGRVQSTNLQLRTVEVTNYEGNSIKNIAVGDTSKRISNGFGGADGFTNMFRVGVTFNFTENVWTEAATGVWGSNGAHAISTFGDNRGLFNFGSIMVGLKF